MMMVLWFQRAGSGVICVRLPVRSSSSGQYESSRDVKRYLVSALGNINHTLFGSLSLWCPLSPVVSCELLPRRPGQGCWQPMKAMQAGLCPCISLLRPQRHGPRPDGWRAGRRALAISLYFIATAAQTGGQWAGEWKYSAKIPSSFTSAWPCVD